MSPLLQHECSVKGGEHGGMQSLRPTCRLPIHDDITCCCSAGVEVGRDLASGPPCPEGRGLGVASAGIWAAS